MKLLQQLVNGGALHCRNQLFKKPMISMVICTGLRFHKGGDLLTSQTGISGRKRHISTVAGVAKVFTQTKLGAVFETIPVLV